MIRVIKAATEDMPGVSYIDLQSVFRTFLEGQPVSPYIPRNAPRFLHKALPLHDKRTIEKRSTERRRRLTLDGVHLNADGAELVAQKFLQKIREWEAKVDSPDTIPDAG